PFVDFASLLVTHMGFVGLARVWSTPILAIRPPGLLHPQGTICQGRNHKGAVRPDDAGPTTAQSGLPERIGDAKTLRVILPLFSSAIFLWVAPLEVSKKTSRVSRLRMARR